MNKTIWWLAAAGVLLIGAGTFALSAMVQVQNTTPNGIPQGTPKEEVLRIAKEMSRPTVHDGAVAVVDEAHYDFGMMDPGTSKTHTFEIRNTGFQSLNLGTPRTSCSCADATLLDRVVEPGGSGRVEVFWDPGPYEKPLDIDITLHTSDPNNDQIRFNITGAVRRTVQAEPDRLALRTSEVDNTPQSAQTLVYSQAWEDFTLDDMTSTMDGLTWDIAPADAALLAEKQALAGYLMTFHFPDDLPNGFVSERVDFKAAPSDGSSEPAEYLLPIEGKITGRIGIYGNNIDATGLINLGVLRRGYEKRLRFVVKVRDPQKELPNPRFEVSPDFLKAELHSQTNVAAGLYFLDIIIPADAPTCLHLSEDCYGKVELLTDHPRIPSRLLRLKFAVNGSAQD